MSQKQTRTVLGFGEKCETLSESEVLRIRPGVHGAHRNHEAKSIGQLKLDMTVWFTPTADNYFSKVGKPQILQAIQEAKGQPHAPALEKLKKGELAKEAERLLAGTGWLPKPLRPAE